MKYIQQTFDSCISSYHFTEILALIMVVFFNFLSRTSVLSVNSLIKKVIQCLVKGSQTFEWKDVILLCDVVFEYEKVTLCFSPEEPVDLLISWEKIRNVMLLSKSAYVHFNALLGVRNKTYFEMWDYVPWVEAPFCVTRSCCLFDEWGILNMLL